MSVAKEDGDVAEAEMWALGPVVIRGIPKLLNRSANLERQTVGTLNI
jgi:hypothetical protein